MHSFAYTKSSLQLILLCFLGGVLVPDYWVAGLKKHNLYRKAHNTPLLELDHGLAHAADKCAQYYANRGGNTDHSCPYKKPWEAGENLYGSRRMDMTGPEAVELATKRWYDEIEYYNFDKNDGKLSETGHFTQVVWKGSKKLGMGYVKQGELIIVVGLYTPHGNVMGKKKENVLPFSAEAAAAAEAEPEAEAGGSDSDKSGTPSSGTLITGRKPQGAICLALVISAGLVAGGY